MMTIAGRYMRILILVVIAVGTGLPGSAIAAPKAPKPEMIKIADDLYFWFHYRGTNSAIWVTDEGVMVMETQRHPREAEKLVQRIRKITDKPIRWAFNTQAHGDHYMGNGYFKKIGATVVTQKEVARIMRQYWDKEKKRRLGYFKKRKLDPDEVTLESVLPDKTFDKEMVITMGGKKAVLMYPGESQDPGCSLVYFPHRKALVTGGCASVRSFSNTMFTSSIDNWINVVKQVRDMDVETYLPGHGPVGTKKDMQLMVDHLTDLQNGVKAAIAKGLSKKEAGKLTFMDKYHDWRGAGRAGRNIEFAYHLLTTGKSWFLDREK
ncbi:MAG: MBL fold metallo-hydrolase [Rhodospirillales bacterium]